jgi:hypothetical protein
MRFPSRRSAGAITSPIPRIVGGILDFARTMAADATSV